MIYLASPYSHPDAKVRLNRFKTVCRAAGILMNSGHLVFSPIAHTHPIALSTKLPLGWQFWERYDREFINRCDELCVLMIDGWVESKGVQAEIAIAKELNKRVLGLKRCGNKKITSRWVGGDALIMDLDKVGASNEL